LKTVLLGITGGIAAYKAAELARLFIRDSIQVQAVMTAAAVQFVAPLTFETITGRDVPVEMFGAARAGKVRHISIAEQADVMVVAPASANTLSKMALGVADNLLTTLYLAVNCPVVLVPSMNENMLAHPAVQENLGRLRAAGCLVMEPGTGELACGVVGKGRMPEPQDIYRYVCAAMAPKDFRGVKALVTAGPTREHFDPVRFISNPSTGLMGYALAQALADRGAEVTLVSGPSVLACPAGVERVAVTSAVEMHREVLSRYDGCDLVIKAAAVSDYRPSASAPQKVKKREPAETVLLTANPDILKDLGLRKGKQLLVGFAAETENAEAHALKKLKEKNLDLIVLNDLTAPGTGFGCLTNQAILIDRRGSLERLPLMKKETLAHLILDRVKTVL
jgi:phosphopantothenoylcysteine decarboxylase/phosphopantothenate--cysteine ligase